MIQVASVVSLIACCYAGYKFPLLINVIFLVFGWAIFTTTVKIFHWRGILPGISVLALALWAGYTNSASIIWERESETPGSVESILRSYDILPFYCRNFIVDSVALALVAAVCILYKRAAADWHRY